MNDMERVQRLIAIKEAFTIDQELIDDLLSQISDKNLVQNLDRIARGLKVEDNYKFIYASMPWVKNINGLKQDQEKSHKKEYQVPDYSIIIEDAQKNRFPVLVDVKSVNGEKQSCEIMQKQVKILQQYSADNKTPLLIAIYWEKYGYWTHNCLKNFGGKKNYKITIAEAMSNDLSHIFGDLTYILTSNFYRRSEFENNGIESVARHETYGEIKKVELSKDNANYVTYSTIESAIIDAMIKMKPIQTNQNGIITQQIEVSEQLPMMIKLSNWILRLLTITGIDTSTKIGDYLITDYARRFIIELMKSMEVTVSYPMPKEKNKCTDYFYNTAYKNTWVIERYNKS